MDINYRVYYEKDFYFKHNEYLALGFLVDEWRSGGIPLEGTKRETFNIVFSMPEGVERKPVYDAVKAFAQKEVVYQFELHPS